MHRNYIFAAVTIFQGILQKYIIQRNKLLLILDYMRVVSLNIKLSSKCRLRVDEIFLFYFQILTLLNLNRFCYFYSTAVCMNQC